MSGFRCLALEAGVAAATVAACNGNRQCEIGLPEGRKAAGALFDAVDEVLESTGLSLRRLDCIAFGKGPGSFTGLRVAAAAAQGLGIGLGLRLCPVSSLASLAQDALDGLARSAGRGDVLVAPVLDAGRGEVYSGWYQAGESGLVVPRDEDRIANANDLHFPGAAKFVAAGGAWAGCVAARPAQQSRIVSLAPAARPRARTVLRLAREAWRRGLAVPPQNAQPVYFRAAV